MRQTILDKYRLLATEKEDGFLSPEDELKDCLLWQEQRDEKALERLIIDKAMLVWDRTKDLRGVFRDTASAQDIDQWAVEGIQKGVETYPAGKTDVGLNTYILNGARWNIFDEILPYLEQNHGMNRKAEQLLEEESRHLQRELTRPEQEAVLASLSPSLTKTFFARQKENTQTFSEIAADQMIAQNVLSDDHPKETWSAHDVAERLPGTDESSDPYLAAVKAGMQKDVRDLLDTLPKQMKQIIVMRYGVGFTDRLCADESKPDHGFMTRREIGEAFDVSQQMIGNIEDRALKKLQKPLTNEHLASYMEADVSEEAQIGFDPYPEPE